MSIANISWAELCALSANRPIYAFGRSEEWIEKLQRQVDLQGIFDSNIQRCVDYNALPTIHKQRIQEFKALNPYLVITCSAVFEISEFLQAEGFTPGLDFTVLPDIRDALSINRLNTPDGKFLFTTSDHEDNSQRGSTIKGGVFLGEYKAGRFEFHRKYAGSMRELACDGLRYFAVDGVNQKLAIFDFDLNLTNEIELPHANCCGVGITAEKIVIANSSRDSLLIFDLDSFSFLGEVFISPLSGAEALSRLHINDICIIPDGRILVSMFSKTGLWRSGVMDGGVCVLDENMKIVDYMIGNLQQPHTPRLIDGEVFVANSFAGQILRNSDEVILESDGFLRGIAPLDEFLLVGQSQPLYLERKLKKKLATNVTAGFYILDTRVSAYSFWPLAGVKNIHSIMALKS